MRFQLAFGYFINRTGGGSNLLWLTLCQFIPVVGPIVLAGYRARVAVSLIRDPDMLAHPKFDWNHFSKHLMRGLWPFLMAMIVSLAVFLVMGIAFGIGLAVGAAANNPGLGLLIGIPVYLVGVIALTMISVPMTFHSGLVNRFDFPAAWRFARRFWGLVAAQAIVTGLVFFLLAMVVALLGLLCCFIGIYPASIIITMAGEHLMVQLYVEYLARGGESIEGLVPGERLADDEWDVPQEDDERRDERRPRD